jgi:hypothetical protein
MTTKRLTQLIQTGLYLLVALIPFHAIFVVGLGHFIGHATLWASWKEILLLVLSSVALLLVARSPETRSRLHQPVIYLIIGFAAIALFITLLTRPGLTMAAFGAKTDLEFLLATVLSALVATKMFLRRLVLILLGATVLVAIFALLQATVLPKDFLTHLGYGFTAGQPAPYQTVLIGQTVHNRFGSTLGGPNQLGTYLILPLALSFLFGLRERRWWLLSLAIIPAIFVSYSRGAWIGAAAALVLCVLLITRGRTRVIAGALSGLIIVASLALAIIPGNPISTYLHHPSPSTSQNSDTQHAASLASGSIALIHVPLGHGLGTAGPATFHAGVVNIIEDDYLQVGYELGIIGLLLFVVLIALTVTYLSRQTSLTAVATAGAILGISLTALVLPAWTDTSTALTVWTIAGASLGVRHV